MSDMVKACACIGARSDCVLFPLLVTLFSCFPHFLRPIFAFVICLSVDYLATRK